MKAGWDAVGVEAHVYHITGSLGDDDDASVCARGRLHGGVEYRCLDQVRELMPRSSNESCPGVLMHFHGKQIPSMRLIFRVG